MTTNPVTPPPAAAAEAPKTFWQKAQQWFLIVCGIIIGLLGLLKLYTAFTPQLPGCAADTTATVLRDIFKKKDVELTVLNNMKTVTDTSSEQTCQAHIKTPAETGTISYNITCRAVTSRSGSTRWTRHRADLRRYRSPLIESRARAAWPRPAAHAVRA